MTHYVLSLKKMNQTNTTNIEEFDKWLEQLIIKNGTTNVELVLGARCGLVFICSNIQSRYKLNTITNG